MQSFYCKYLGNSKQNIWRKTISLRPLCNIMTFHNEYDMVQTLQIIRLHGPMTLEGI